MVEAEIKQNKRRMAMTATELNSSQDTAEIHGRAVQQAEHGRSFWTTLKRDPWLIFWMSVVLWSLIVRGFETQAAGSLISIQKFKERFGVLQNGEYFIETKWQSALSGGGAAASIVGACLASYFSSFIGTKPVILSASVIGLCSVGIEFASLSIDMFMGGKLMNYVAVGVMQNACTNYICEVAPLALRSSAIGGCNLAQCIGPLVCAGMSYRTAEWETDWSWRSLVCAQWGFAAVAMVGQIFMPESPVFYVRHGHMDKAQRVLRRLYSRADDADGHLQRIRFTLAEAEAEAEETMWQRGGGYSSYTGGAYAACFRGTNLRRTLVSSMIAASEPMAGLGFVSAYGALMYQYLGIGNRQSFLLQMGAQILSVAGAAIALVLNDVFGRRPSYLWGCGALAVLLLCMGVSGSLNSPAATTASVGFYTMYNFFYNVGVGSTVYTLAGELPTSELRAQSLAISFSVAMALLTMWSFVCPYIFNPGYGNLKAKIGFVFGAIMIVWLILGWFFVPETRRRSYEELDELFMNRVPTRQFSRYITVAERRAEEAYRLEQKD